MNKQEAIEAVRNGNKVTHTSFTNQKTEYVTLDKNNKLIDEDDRNMGEKFWSTRNEKSWDKNWSIFGNKIYKPYSLYNTS